MRESRGDADENISNVSFRVVIGVLTKIDNKKPIKQDGFVGKMVKDVGVNGHIMSKTIVIGRRQGDRYFVGRMKRGER